MIRHILFLLVTLALTSSLKGQGYVQDYHSIGVSLSVLNHHADVLDNRENNTSYLSHIVKLNYSRSISSLFNFHQQLGLGYYQNAAKNEPYWTKSPVYSYSVNLSMNVPKFFVRKYQFKINPYANVGYNFAYHQQSSNSRTTKIISDFLVGGGVSYQVNDYINLYSQLNISQRLGLDFQTTLQTQVGLNALLIK